MTLIGKAAWANKNTASTEKSDTEQNAPNDRKSNKESRSLWGNGKLRNDGTHHETLILNTAFYSSEFSSSSSFFSLCPFFPGYVDNLTTVSRAIKYVLRRGISKPSYNRIIAWRQIMMVREGEVTAAPAIANFPHSSKYKTECHWQASGCSWLLMEPLLICTLQSKIKFNNKALTLVTEVYALETGLITTLRQRFFHPNKGCINYKTYLLHISEMCILRKNYLDL